jgi:polyketide synthase PksN
MDRKDDGIVLSGKNDINYDNKIPAPAWEEENSEYGFDSIISAELANRLNQIYQLHLTPALFFEYSTIERLVAYMYANCVSTLFAYFDTSARNDCLAGGHAQSGQTGQGPSPSSTPFSSEVLGTPIAPVTPVDPVTPIDPVTPVTTAPPIAIIGMSGCFPLAPDVQSLWHNLLAGRDCIGEIPPSRWDWQTCFGNSTTEVNSTNIKWAGIVDDVETFDPQFFGISPHEAELMDPHQRLLMMYVWKAIEDAGYDASSLSGTNTALFVGTMSSGYSERLSRAGMAIEGSSSTSLVPSVGPNRMSYFLDLHGPSEPIETACSSSLIAIHRGVHAQSRVVSVLWPLLGASILWSPPKHTSVRAKQACSVLMDAAKPSVPRPMALCAVKGSVYSSSRSSPKLSKPVTISME